MQGLRILDLTDAKGSFCGKLLADMGADVVKIEPPRGDSSRSFGPFWAQEDNSKRSLSFWYNNTSKKGITLNVNKSRGREILSRLAGSADVLLESFHPGYLTARKVGYESLAKHNPRLIMTSITAFGQTGPYRNWACCDLVASALAGQMYVNGNESGPPLRAYGEQAYLVASIYAAIGTLMALRTRRINGEGQWVDISMHECCAGVTEHVSIRHFYERVVARRQGTLHWNNAFRIFPCLDGYVLLTLFQEWDTIVELLDSEGLAEDLKEGKWQKPEARQEGLGHIIEVLQAWTKTHVTKELVELGQAMRLPWAKVNSVRDLSNNPHLLERGFFVQLNHAEEKGTFVYPGAPCKLSRSPWRIWRRAPLLGEHNQEILGGELGLSSQDMAALALEEVI